MHGAGRPIELQLQAVSHVGSTAGVAAAGVRLPAPPIGGSDARQGVPAAAVAGHRRWCESSDRVEPAVVVRGDAETHAVIHRQHGDAIEVVSLVELVGDAELERVIYRHGVQEVVHIGPGERRHDRAAERSGVQSPAAPVPGINQRARARAVV